MKTNTMKKFLSLSAAAALALSLTACSGNTSGSGSSGGSDASGSGSSGGTVYKVGICNYVDDASLNQIVDNIRTRLETLGEENVVVK